MVQATQLRPGMIIIHAGDLFRVTAVHHLTPGNKRGFMQTKMKNLRTGIGTEYKFRSEDRVDQAILDNRQMQYLYAEGDMHTFMDTENYEQITLTASDIGDLLITCCPTPSSASSFMTANQWASIRRRRSIWKSSTPNLR